MAAVATISGGFNISRTTFKSAPDGQWERFICPKCNLLLRNAVQPSCGHRMCQVCVDTLFDRNKVPKCPECDDVLVEEEGARYFPDRFVRREIQSLCVFCTNRPSGCDWEGKFGQLEEHMSKCDYGLSECEFCRSPMPIDKLADHQHVCPQAPHPCPCASLGCSTDKMVAKDMEQHISGNLFYHLTLLVNMIMSLYPSAGSKALPPRTEADGGTANEDEGYQTLSSMQYGQRGDLVEQDGTAGAKPHLVMRSPTSLPFLKEGCRDGPKGGEQLEVAEQFSHLKSKTEFKAVVSSPYLPLLDQELPKMFSQKLTKLRDEFIRKLDSASDEARRKEEEIVSLRMSVSKLEKMVRAKNAEIEDRDFRLSLIENSNYDGTMVWKIPQFSQRMDDAKSGKYTSIFSLPFYTNRYGYKMCLRLYILGDGIGKGSHMSLFFVIMRGEFDNILQWPFTHKVTFRLINQTGARDITDTFQPDPMSSSFKKPKSDMNIASGCPRFVSLDDLQSGGFIVEDTVFIKCTVDKTTIRNP